MSIQSANPYITIYIFYVQTVAKKSPPHINAEGINIHIRLNLKYYLVL